jgi:hypothetical protein
MRNVLILVAILLVCVVGLGFYQGWFHLTSQESDNKSHITLTVDQDKMRADEKKVESLGKRSTENTTEKQP